MKHALARATRASPAGRRRPHLRKQSAKGETDVKHTESSVFPSNSMKLVVPANLLKSFCVSTSSLLPTLKHATAGDENTEDINRFKTNKFAKFGAPPRKHFEHIGSWYLGRTRPKNGRHAWVFGYAESNRTSGGVRVSRRLTDCRPCCNVNWTQNDAYGDKFGLRNHTLWTAMFWGGARDSMEPQQYSHDDLVAKPSWAYCCGSICRIWNGAPI